LFEKVEVDDVDLIIFNFIIMTQLLLIYLQNLTAEAQFNTKMILFLSVANLKAII